ncbi:MAG: TVP38/TMEM64 family protein [Clostridia bacterium]|nr:TVP38/TMEM64 family protein [Clostridia bacterium]
MKYTGLWEYVNSIEKIQSLVERGGVFSTLTFIILQILQTTILQIPSLIVTAAGAIIFGRWTAFLLSYFSIMVGSIIMFWIGRRFGRKFLVWFVGDDASEKWIKRLSNGKYLFFLMMLFPLFPDDILCVVAGTTNISFNFFFWTNILARGIGIATTVFFASGEVIPFSGWGLLIWGVIAVVVLILFYISVRYQDKIDEFIQGAFYKNKK